MKIFVHHEKGDKGKYTQLSQRNLKVLREYWREYRQNIRRAICFIPENKGKKY
ncbi:putative site-specific recombinase [Oscillibacter valericigenes Sjm18-20]|nr:putative site-specific recombinase [Oscillibacter valericigenes Sjm18-20]